MRCIRCVSGMLFLAAISFASAQDTPKTEEKKPAPKIDKIDEAILNRAKLTTEPDGLLDFLKKRILPEKDRPDLERLVRNLASPDYRVREKATRDLSKRGVLALDVLRSGGAVDCEAIRRIEHTIRTIREDDVGPEVPAAAVRVAALLKPAALVETLIGFAPFADNEAVLDEIRIALTAHALKDGKADPLLVAALTDRAAARRAIAGEALVRTAFAGHKEALRKLLGDADSTVRYRVARAMVFAQERDAVPVLIDVLADLSTNAAWQTEDLLLKVAAGASPPETAMGNDQAAREKCKTAWQEWWKKRNGKIDLTKLVESPKLQGRTLVILLDQNTVMDLGPDNQPRFEIKGFNLPLDVQLLDENRVLVAEYYGNRVTERNQRGEILWQKMIPPSNTGIASGPQVAQRLANGHTFIATANRLLEVDKDDNEVVNIRLAPDGQQVIMKAMKLDNGEIVCMLADGHMTRYDAKGNEVHSFSIPVGKPLFGGRVHMLPNGRVVVPHNAEGKVVEYDTRGKPIWEVPFESPVAATRLPNGNTLITSYSPWVGAIEVDRTGAHVWSFTHPASNSKITRAIRR